MVRVLAICRQCGDVEVTLDDIRLRVWTDSDRGEYTLHCPDCATPSVWAAGPETIDLLVASGASFESVSVGPRPSGSPDRPSRPGAPGAPAARHRWPGRRPHRNRPSP